MIDIPIIYLSYRRPQCVENVLPIILRQNPCCVYVHSDGALNDSHRQGVQQSRIKIDDMLQIYNGRSIRIYQNTNLMCGGSFKRALDKVLLEDGYDMCILVPEDCVPADSTFIWLYESLIEYRSDTSVGLIASTKSDKHKYILPSFFIFGIYKRTQLAYNENLQLFKSRILNRVDFNIIQNQTIRESKYSEYASILNLPNYRGWDFKMQYSVIKSKLHTIYPTSNLVQYIGFTNPTHSHHNCQHLKLWKIEA